MIFGSSFFLNFEIEFYWFSVFFFFPNEIYNKMFLWMNTYLFSSIQSNSTRLNSASDFTKLRSSKKQEQEEKNKKEKLPGVVVDEQKRKKVKEKEGTEKKLFFCMKQFWLAEKLVFSFSFFFLLSFFFFIFLFHLPCDARCHPTLLIWSAWLIEFQAEQDFAACLGLLLLLQQQHGGCWKGAL